LREQGTEDLLVETVTADAQILIALASRRGGPRPRYEMVRGPPLGDPHPFGMAHRDGLVNWVSDEAPEDIQQRFLQEITNGEFGFHATWINVAVRFD
jgi:hypothetical protein